MYTPREPELAELVIADPPGRWRELGFDVDDKGHVDIGGVRIRLGGDGSGISAWSLMRVNAMGAIDGLPSPVPRVLYPPPFKTHPNGATGIDHLVIVERDELETDGARFWGLAVSVISIDAIAEQLGDRLGPIKQATQPGRRIATLRPEAGISAPLAFMSPEPP